MKIIITGATGFIGRYLVLFFSERKFPVVALSRNPQKAKNIFPPHVTCLPWKNMDAASWLDELDGPAAVINLIGENIAGALWTRSYKQKLRDSRLNSVETIVQAFQQAPGRDHILIQASAVGYYGNVHHKVDETSPAGSDFLARLVVEWENASKTLEAVGVRRVLARLGVVLGREGALRKMILPYKLFAGGPLGSGKQGFPWIHIADVARAMLLMIEHDELYGVFNFVAPQTVTQKEFSRALGKVLHRPAWLPAPAPLLKLLLGEMARSALLSGQFVEPKKLLAAGFRFQFPELKKALEDILK
ncbi:protein of unknown function DUF1731 [Caldithrix abyssi DSM 13497]|uniref:TIGR01777 family protein n=1 Tax=Caldithrix abyssi DSM 13497 TaxID=880073 RepID=H1XT33_CALAY|nr:TIGR01777 family oxidoreductase [Caldithrix abyssi]APF18611.1 hypothetical protein Cabys_1862 [Caldithrix abyssi DSM 13497]EHO42600.1 protein of unknown function DUF1731 [Caldithrix abyssi DSM 13497]